jgi:hypothetical protein
MAIALIIFSSVRKKKLQYILGFFICKKKSYPVHFRRLYYCKLQTVFMTTIYDFVKHGFICFYFNIGKLNLDSIST